MKRLLVFGLIIVLFGGCMQNQEREVYFKITILTNPTNATTLSFLGGAICTFTNTIPISVGSTCTGEIYLLAKGSNISVVAYGHNDYNNANEVIGWEVEFYVDDDLEETRSCQTGIHNGDAPNFIVP